VERRRTREELASLVGTTLGGRFLVRRVLGSGGMGAVYEVAHVVTRREGALKLLHPSYAAVPAVVERFVREASAAGRIESRHIVEAFDAGTLPSGEPYIFMELLRGNPVSALIATRGRLRLEEARDIVAQAALGLSAAHGSGIAHRDVKPDNLFLCSGPTPLVKIVDFGISKFESEPAEQRLTTEGAPIGTPQYMSPEQVVGGRDVDFRTDIYSLGVVLYECLTGQLPFSAETLPALGVKIFEGRYVPATELVPELPEAVDTVIARAMAPVPRERFGAMLAFRDALLELSTRPAHSLGATLVSEQPPPPPAADDGTAPGVASVTDPAFSSDPPACEPSPGALPLDATARARVEPEPETAGQQAASHPRPASRPVLWRALSGTGVVVALAGTGVVVALAGAAALALRQPAPAEPVLAGPAPRRDAALTSAAPGESAPAIEATVAPVADASVQPPQAPASVASASVSAVAASRPVPPRAARDRAKAAPAMPISSSRVARDGLGTENPFK
jgi:serine/threonine-protein kinase